MPTSLPTNLATRLDGARVAAAVDAGLSVEEIAALFEVAGSEEAAMASLDDSVARLREVQRAKAELRQVPPTQLRAALELRASALRGATA
ncbi:hypothetical protein [Nocardioides marmoraquaticus]